jgi:hypothetical protein
MADNPDAVGWKEAGELLEQILAQGRVPANIAKPVVARAMKLFGEFFAQMRDRAPRNPGLDVPLSEDERKKLQAFYSAYELAVVQSIVLAVIETELPKFKPT